MTISSIPSSGLWGAIAALLNGNFNDLKERMGWADYNDVATIASPVALTVANTNYELTNDGAGSNTNKDHIPVGHGEIWDATTDRLDFSSLKVGDIVTIRGDITFHSSGANRAVQLAIELGTGSGTEVLLPVAAGQFKTAGDHQIVGLYSFYIGAAFIQSNPARILAQSDGTGDTVTVNGWFIKTEVR